MQPYAIPSIRELHQLLQLPKPKHPLVSVIDFAVAKCFDDEKLEAVRYGFYCIALKRNFKGKMRYGQKHYDFDDGVMTFFAPNQVVITEIRDDWELEGAWLVLHPDFINGTPLAAEIRKYGYFSYAVNEALHLSQDEEQMVMGLMAIISDESAAAPDTFSHQIIIKQVQLLLSYCDRFYHRQFLTRRQGSNDLLAAFEELLDSYFRENRPEAEGIPPVSFFADKLNLSRNYLSDMLRSTTGQSAQQHIQQKLVESAKELLAFSDLNISEVAYRLGFEHPQSFHKLFKNKTALSPLEYRRGLNRE
ncbi:helix-turn-helix domain-containing protein [Pontibacter akesuensis]|uniref:Helix-turn-helix domain-containing protein n=1 Tax=Pontibacter akesuensis TaxID=388950 RepID=A0A1I7GJT4_9BACT|nr:AraC family transcriptional regulator [Pontibacter akesuensis]GHA56401.1 AraC family transcriptional regulator [Pontibacter akesuensis]SFU48704.1 Helix-turn-helix domain-containing protein [Pontibacter akesuensis]